MGLPPIKMRKRSIVMFTLLIGLLMGLIGRIGYWQIIRGEELKILAIQQQTSQTTVTANRGTIYDRNGKALAQSASVDTVVCNPQVVKDENSAEIIAAKLSPILNIEYNNLYSLLTKKNRYQIIKKRITIEESQAIKDLKDPSKYPQNGKAEVKKFSGVYFEQDSKRYYSYNISPHVIGFTGYDNNGLQGVEMTFDDVLTGRAGSVLTAKAANGINMDFQYEQQQDSQKGADVVLTIDETIQHFLEKHLETAVFDNQLKEGSAGIIMNPKTGEILAMATKPDFDINDPYNIEQFEKYAVNILPGGSDLLKNPNIAPQLPTDAQQIGSIRNKMWRNKAISDTYEPGSTFKILTAAMALEEHVVDLDSQFYCSGSYTVLGRTMSCAKKSGHGAETFVQGVLNSCNPVFMQLGLRVGSEKFMEYFKAFGLTEKTGIELIGEAGSIYYRKDKLSDVDLATSAFGQGFSITPLQLITSVASVINGGDLMKPQIIKEIRNENGVIRTFSPEVRNKVISKETSDTMREILEAVVSSPTATGKNAYIPGYRIGGKTGTSEKGRNNDKRIASFVGFAPADDPQLVCLVMMDEPQAAVRFGGTIAAPVVGSILEETLQYLGVPRQYTEKEMSQMQQNVPEVRGLSLNDAKNKMTSEHLNVKVSGNGTTVVDQLPKPGTTISPDSTVILYTSPIEGDNLVTVPDVLGLSLEDAKGRLKSTGLNMEVVGAGLLTSTEAYAAKQSIGAGEKVSPATVVGVEFRNTSID